jgi:hypothetical protein
MPTQEAGLEADAVWPSTATVDCLHVLSIFDPLHLTDRAIVPKGRTDRKRKGRVIRKEEEFEGLSVLGSDPGARFSEL